MNELSEHLGGHLDRTHVDRGVLDLITTKYSIASMIDIGCGPGGMYSIAKDCGIDWRGIDGDYTLNYSEEMKPLVTIHDFVEPYIPQHITDSQFDLAFSVEFLEHVEERGDKVPTPGSRGDVLTVDLHRGSRLLRRVRRGQDRSGAGQHEGDGYGNENAMWFHSYGV